MKKFLAILILIFTLQTPSQAGDIKEFEIQGVTIGDSLLKIYSEEEIKKFLGDEEAINFYPKSKKFILLATFGKDENFDQLNIDLKYLDKKYIIYGISNYKRLDINACLEEKKSVLIEIKELFNANNFKESSWSQKHRADKTGNSKWYETSLNFKNGDEIRIVCTDWGKEFEKKGYGDNLDVSLASKELMDFLTNEAY